MAVWACGLGPWRSHFKMRDGGRSITVDVATGKVLDLSQLRWDAWFSLAPDGKRLLLTNGRGGFWTSEVTYSNAEGKQ